MVAMYKERAYIVEAKSWDDTDSDEEKENGHLALLIDSSEESRQESQRKVRKNKVVWILNSYSKYITGEKSLLIDVVEKSGLVVIFENDSKRFTMGYRKFRN